MSLGGVSLVLLFFASGAVGWGADVPPGSGAAPDGALDAACDSDAAVSAAESKVQGSAVGRAPFGPPTDLHQAAARAGDSRRGNTVLHWAVIHRRPEAIRALLESVGDVDLQEGLLLAENNAGKTPLRVAVEAVDGASKKGKAAAEAVVRALIESAPVRSWLTGVEQRFSKKLVFREIRHPRMGLAWLAPDGRIIAKDLLRNADGRVRRLRNWGMRIVDGIILDSRAALACLEAGGILANAKDLKALMKLLGAEKLTRGFVRSKFSRVGLKRFRNLIPAVKNRDIWSASVGPYSVIYAIALRERNGDLDGYVRGYKYGAALCVGP